MNIFRSTLLLAALAPLTTFAQFTLIETGGTFRSGVTNLAIGATAIGQDEYGDPHLITNINDGQYGNDRSWLGRDVFDENADAVTQLTDRSWIGVEFSSAVSIGSIALGRDNLGAFTDRASYSYLIQITTLSNGAWTDIGTIDPTVLPSPARRHLFNLNTPLADVTAIRISTTTGVGYGNAIDELEVYATAAIPEPSTYAALAGLGALGLVIWRRRKTRRT